MEAEMPRAVTLFMIFAPEDRNDEIVASAELLESHMATEFRGYHFEVVDLNDLKPVEPGQTVRFGDGTDFAIIPLMGLVNADEIAEMARRPDKDLISDMYDACRKFDPAKARRLAA
jgi:hypothetical protein